MVKLMFINYIYIYFSILTCFTFITGSEDYVETTEVFVFSDSQQQFCANVPKISDNIHEGSESFFGNLFTNASRVTLDPESTEITFIDNDYISEYDNIIRFMDVKVYISHIDTVIGFIDPPYSTSEESGFVTLPVGVLSAGGALYHDFVVRLETRDLTGIMNTAEGAILLNVRVSIPTWPYVFFLNPS